MMLTDAVIAEYFCKGIETALLSPAQARAWADSVIVSTDNPPYAFIEISLSQGVQEIVSALKAVPGERDQGEAGKWLLDILQRAEIQSTEGLAAAVSKAMVVCRHCGLSDEIYYEFDCIDDSLFLARHGEYGTVDECRADFLASLQRHALPFPGVSEAQPRG